MILSLKDDVDDDVLEDAIFKEAGPFEVKEVLSVLQRLSSSCEENKSRFPWEILSEIDNDSATVDSLGTFVRELNDVVRDVVRNCYKSVDKDTAAKWVRMLVTCKQPYSAKWRHFSNSHCLFSFRVDKPKSK